MGNLCPERCGHYRPVRNGDPADFCMADRFRTDPVGSDGGICADCADPGLLFRRPGCCAMPGRNRRRDSTGQRGSGTSGNHDCLCGGKRSAVFHGPVYEAAGCHLCREPGRGNAGYPPQNAEPEKKERKMMGRISNFTNLHFVL